MERLAEEGWHEQIVSHREEYLQCITNVEGVSVARPLAEKGTSAHILEKMCNLRTTFSVE